jgi:glycerate-2-kinase
VCRHLLLQPESKIAVYEGGQFSYPDQEAYNAAQQMIKLLSGRKATDLVIVLISGKWVGLG